MFMSANNPENDTSRGEEMNKFDQIKQEILKETPHVSTLPFLKRMAIWFRPEMSQAGITVSFPDTGTSQFTQYYITEMVNGKEYMRRWGKLK
jgi:hypothetical protein